MTKKFKWLKGHSFKRDSGAAYYTHTIDRIDKIDGAETHCCIIEVYSKEEDTELRDTIALLLNIFQQED